MKNVFEMLRRGKSTAEGRDDNPESQFFTTGFQDVDDATVPIVHWAERAKAIGARKLARPAPVKRLKELWNRDRFMAGLSPDDLEKCARHFEFYAVDANKDLIAQSEYGGFMVVVLHGVVAVDRQQPWGERLRLTEVRAGNVLGEMSLLDAGPRWSYCTALNPCEVAVLEAGALDTMIEQDPGSAARLIGSLARRLSLRLRKLGVPAQPA
jgi:cAMP-binding proteins - catabolite gene activator and regulatory subunit of cAMP-dependent protein kinases